MYKANLRKPPNIHGRLQAPHTDAWCSRLHEQPLALRALVRSVHQSMACTQKHNNFQTGMC